MNCITTELKTKQNMSTAANNMTFTVHPIPWNAERRPHPIPRWMEERRIRQIEAIMARVNADYTPPLVDAQSDDEGGD